VKKKLNIQTLISLRETIETLLSNSTDVIIKNNPVDKEYKGEIVDTEKEYDKLERLFDQLNKIKIAIEEANSQKTNNEKTNKELVFELSNLRRKEKLLEILFTSKNKNRKGSKENAYRFQITKSIIDKKLSEVQDRISDIKSTMTEFNNSTIVEVDLDESLDLL